MVGNLSASFPGLKKSVVFGRSFKLCTQGPARVLWAINIYICMSTKSLEENIVPQTGVETLALTTKDRGQSDRRGGSPKVVGRRS